MASEIMPLFMQKKFIISGVSLLFVVGLTFVVAKMKPCNAQMMSCEGKPAPIQSSNLVDKRVPISDYSQESVQKSPK